MDDILKKTILAVIKMKDKKKKFLKGEQKIDKTYTLSGKNSSDKSVEISAWCRKFRPTKYFVRRKFCPTKFCPIRYGTSHLVIT